MKELHRYILLVVAVFIGAYAQGEGMTIRVASYNVHNYLSMDRIVEGRWRPDYPKPEKEKDKSLKMGKWNKMKIRVVGDQVETWLNGTSMVSLKDEKIGQGKGSIALQIHDGGGIKVRWKNLKIKTL